MPPRAIIFDLDGVLVDSYGAHFEGWRRLAAETGRGLDEATFLPWFGRTGSDTVRGLWGPEMSDAAVRRLVERKMTIFADVCGMPGGCPPVDGAAELVTALAAAGFRLGIATAGPRASLDLLLPGLPVAAKLSVRIAAEDVSRTKPDPAPYKLAAERLGVAPRDAAAIDDSPAGVASARAAGMAVIGLAARGRSPHDLAEAHLVVASLWELGPCRVEALIRRRGA